MKVLIFRYFYYLCADKKPMKTLRRHNRWLSTLLAAILLTAFGGKELHTHSTEYYKALSQALERIADDEQTIVNNCSICSFEELTYTEAESFECHLFATLLLTTFEVQPTAEANNIVTTSSLRGPPALS